MYSKISSVSSTLLAALCLTARVVATNTTFYLGGYGTGISTSSASRIFYGDGVAYVGSGTLSNVSNVATIYFTTESTTSYEAPMMLVSETDSVTFSEPTYLALNSSSEYAPVVFVPEEDATDGLTITGFGFYGNYLEWETDSGELEGGWWAVPSGDTDVWIVEFNPNAENRAGAVVLTVKKFSV